MIEWNVFLLFLSLVKISTHLSTIQQAQVSICLYLFSLSEKNGENNDFLKIRHI